MPLLSKIKAKPELRPSTRQQAYKPSRRIYQTHTSTSSFASQPINYTHTNQSIKSAQSTLQSTTQSTYTEALNQSQSQRRDFNTQDSVPKGSSSRNNSMATTETKRCPKASSATLEKLAKLLGDTSLSDFTIKCNDREWRVHRFVLTLHSSVLQAACTHNFKEEKERMIDLSEEDVDSVGAFVYYLYNLNYDAALYREHGDHLSLHVQMCIFGDKYDMKPLQDLAVEKFLQQITKSPPIEKDLADAAICAYDAPRATTEIRKTIVKRAIDQKLIPTEFSDEPANDFERAMQACPGMCVDIVKVQQSMITSAPKSYNCPGCRTVYNYVITMQTLYSTFYCNRCGVKYYGYQWAQSAVH